MTVENLRDLYAQADQTDRREGLLAYSRYGAVLRNLIEFHKWDGEFEHVLAAFVALSPNSDYVGNLRSLVTLMLGVQRNLPIEQVTTSTYRHCLLRAHSYIIGEVNFLSTVRGKKIRAFYDNILRPATSPEVTIDGHMSAAWQGKNLTMREALVKPKTYDLIAEDVRVIAREDGLIPNQMQATLWFTRKRVLGIKYQSQLNLFSAPDDQWSTLLHPRDIVPYSPPPTRVGS